MLHRNIIQPNILKLYLTITLSSSHSILHSKLVIAEPINGDIDSLKDILSNIELNCTSDVIDVSSKMIEVSTFLNNGHLDKDIIEENSDKSVY